MIKENKKMIILTSILTIVPMFAGLALWSKLPAEMATHFGADNMANGWSGKPFAVIGIPLFLLGIHLVCVFATANDPKKQKISKKMFGLILWICPVCSVLCQTSVYGYALGWQMDVTFMAQVLCGVVFLVVGNYLPKSRQNYTVGIKIPWTLADENNWNRTHRLGGKLYMLAGIVFLANIFIGAEWLPLFVILFAAFVPMIYSFALYKGWVK